MQVTCKAINRTKTTSLENYNVQTFWVFFLNLHLGFLFMNLIICLLIIVLCTIFFTVIKFMLNKIYHLKCIAQWHCVSHCSATINHTSPELISFWITETVPTKQQFPISPYSQPLPMTILLYVSMNLTTPGISCK